MSLSPRFFPYLEHFRNTVTLSELLDTPASTPLIGLRHDVDHNIDVALEMAYWEKTRGCRATYFVLHTAPYWEQDEFVEKCLQIEDFGHEIGLHVNALAQWWRGEGNDPAALVKQALARLREGGVQVAGISAHGDKACYEGNFINYWCFRELAPENPDRSESGLCPEGIPAESSETEIAYPEDGLLVRDDGRRLDLWGASMEELGLRYHATHVPADAYFTDSGGSWKRSPDPLTADLKNGRYQVLMHPIHWRGEPKTYFFLSPARSGSKWLATVLDRGSSLVARHEFALNHRRQDGEWIQEKRTGPGFMELIREPGIATQLLCDLRDWRYDSSVDYGEVNVYLEAFVDQISDIFPDAHKVFLARDPRFVVASLMIRGWYETRDDDRHRWVEVRGWGRMDPFERICWYVKDTIGKLSACTDARLELAYLVSDMSALEAALRELGVAFYPRLARPLFFSRVNESKRPAPQYEDWSFRQRHVFDCIFGTQGGRGQGGKGTGIYVALQRLYCWAYHLARMRLAWAARAGRNEPTSQRQTLLGGGNLLSLQPFGVGLEAQLFPDGLAVHTSDDRNAWLSLMGSSWYKLRKGSGWRVPPGHYVRVRVRYRKVGGECRVYGVSYGKKEVAVERRLGAYLRAQEGESVFEFRPATGCTKVDVVLYISSEVRLESLTLLELGLESVPVTALGW